MAMQILNKITEQCFHIHRQPLECEGFCNGALFKSFQYVNSTLSKTVYQNALIPCIDNPVFLYTRQHISIQLVYHVLASCAFRKNFNNQRRCIFYGVYYGFMK